MCHLTKAELLTLHSVDLLVFPASPEGKLGSIDSPGSAVCCVLPSEHARAADFAMISKCPQ